MSDWNVKDLQTWDNRIIDIAKEYGLDWYEISYEICDYYEMIGHMSYHGMPSHYNHWSFGKSFERTNQMYNLGLSGLPYELIINSDPSIAYLMRQNPLYLQILIMAHCVGHSDFFKNNRCFKDTGAETVVSKFRNARNRIQNYSENMNIGVEKVENFLDALHSISFQTDRYNLPRLSRSEIKRRAVNDFNNSTTKDFRSAERLNSKLIQPDHDLLAFLLEYGNYEDWQLDLINIVREQSQYFIPQIKTKILNEGWASFWHYKILHDLKLPQGYHLPFLKMHNAVVCPHIGGINPYHVGFYLFQKIEKSVGLDECFLIRETHDDIAALRKYFDEEDFRELNFFTYGKRKNGTYIEEVSDHDDWRTVRNELIRNVGINTIPQIYVDSLEDNGDLVLKHDHDGRDLDLEYADNVIKHVRNIWPNEVKMFTIIEEELWEI